MVFEGFDSLEDMQRALRLAEEVANRQITPIQAWLQGAYDESHCFARYCEDFMIFGRALSLDEFTELERAAGAPEGELEGARAQVLDRRARGYVFSRCYSVLEPRGEYGDTHVSQVQPIPFALFEYARNHGWTLDPYTTGETA